MKRLLLGFVAGCSSTVDLSGTYMVTSDVSSSPCGADTAVAMPPVYLHFTQSDLFGNKIFSFESCTDAAATMCNSNGIFGGFSEPIDNGWRGIESYDSFSGSLCDLGYNERSAVLTGKMMVIESNEYVDSPMLDQAHCTTNEAEKRGKTMPCMMHERIDATKL